MSSLHAFALRVTLAACLCIALVLLVFLIYQASQILLLVFGGALVAILIRTVSDKLADRTRLSPAWSAVGVVALSILAFAGLFTALSPQVTQQLGQLTNAVPEALDAASEWMSQYPWGRAFQSWLERGKSEVGSENVLLFLSHAGGAANAVLWGAGSAVIVAFVALYLVVNPKLYVTGFLRLIPKAHRPRGAEVLGALAFTLRWWLLASLMKMTAVGLLTFVGLVALGMPLAFILALLAFALDFVPYIGPIVASLPAILLALTTGPEMALYVAIVYLVVQQVESLILSPILFQRTVFLPPVLTVASQLLLGAIAGPLGVVLATPLTAVALVLVKMLYVEDVIGDDMAVDGDAIPADSMPK